MHATHRKSTATHVAAAIINGFVVPSRYVGYDELDRRRHNSHI